MAYQHFVSTKSKVKNESDLWASRIVLLIITYDANLVFSLLLCGCAGAVCAGGAHNYCILFILKESTKQTRDKCGTRSSSSNLKLNSFLRSQKAHATLCRLTSRQSRTSTRECRDYLRSRSRPLSRLQSHSSQSRTWGNYCRKLELARTFYTEMWKAIITISEVSYRPAI